MRHLHKFIITSAVVLASCAAKPDPAALLSEAQQAYENGRYNEAIALIDSLHKVCPTAPERHTALHLYAMAMEQQAVRDIARTDTLVVELQELAESLREGVETALPDSLLLIPRFTDEGSFTVITRCPRLVGHTTVTIAERGGASISTPAVPYDGERNSRTDYGERIFLTDSVSTQVASFISEHRGRPLEITFAGGAESCTLPLDAATADAVTHYFRYADAVKRLHVAVLERERLYRILAVARNQVANTDE